jgi:hypothetical protein
MRFLSNPEKPKAKEFTDAGNQLGDEEPDTQSKWTTEQWNRRNK